MNYNFKEVLSELMEERKINRLQLANILKISSTTMNGYFNYDYYPHIDIAIKLCEYFNCSLDYLFGFSNIAKPKLKVDINYISQNLIKNFNKLLKENNLSIAKAMKKLNMSESSYYRWKMGQFPKTTNLIAIANYFETSIDCLLV